MNDLLKKYNVPGPRYTSYPTVPYWDSKNFSKNKWNQNVVDTFNISNQDGISLYIHLPYCESLCTYCGCNTRITVNHTVEEPYVNAVLKEWQMYLVKFPVKPKIKEIHLGGGTPTFFSEKNLERLIQGILEKSEICSDFEFGFEGHPNYTSKNQLQKLYDLGFRRLSLGVQDFDPVVQNIINRIQSFETVKEISEQASAIGYDSINYDLIYGLPMQTLNSISDTINKVIELRPDRIAFYSYAHIPWLKKGQRKFTEHDLPNGEDKLRLYETGRTMLENAGYKEIGMDHFALKSDSLYKSSMNKKLHRNFMGYTTSETKLLIGLGVSSISDSWVAFAQNVKTVEEYLRLISEGNLPVFKGHILSGEDLIIRQHILNLMCNFETSWSEQHSVINKGISRMTELVNDGLVVFENNKITITEKGRPFVRNVCMALDECLYKDTAQTQKFSTVV